MLRYKFGSFFHWDVVCGLPNSQLGVLTPHTCCLPTLCLPPSPLHFCPIFHRCWLATWNIPTHDRSSSLGRNWPTWRSSSRRSSPRTGNSWGIKQPSYTSHLRRNSKNTMHLNPNPNPSLTYATLLSLFILYYFYNPVQVKKTATQQTRFPLLVRLNIMWVATVQNNIPHSTTFKHGFNVTYHIALVIVFIALSTPHYHFMCYSPSSLPPPSSS